MINNRYDLRLGDCLESMRSMADNSVDSIVTDPPYGLKFMGKKWDCDVPSEAIWRECLRILKPGGHLLAFAGTRTQHRMACRIEDAGFEIRDMIAWVYGSGFPKSHNVGKALEAIPLEDTPEGIDCWDDREKWLAEWNGWGTALKPALEPITVARKPFSCTVAANVMQHGTGAMNIDACRVPPVSDSYAKGYADKCASVVGIQSARTNNTYSDGDGNPRADSAHKDGRWPANLIHDGSADVLAEFPDSIGAGGSLPNVKVTGYGDGIGTGKSEYFGGERTPFDSGNGSAARFFYCAKTSRKDRNEGLGDPGPQFSHGATLRKVENTETKGNNHPTVKPTSLMQYLCRLVTPTGGIVFDPFMGSGSTGKAAMREGFRFIGCELSPEYMDIAKARIEAAILLPDQSDLFGKVA